MIFYRRRISIASWRKAEHDGRKE